MATQLLFTTHSSKGAFPPRVERGGWHWEARRLEFIIERTSGEEEAASLWKGIFYPADKTLPFKKTLAELYSLIFLLIKPSLLRCENDSRLVINCWASHYFKNDLSPKGVGVAQSTVASGSAPAGPWVFRCFGYHKKKGVMNAKCPGILNNHNSQFFFWRGEMVRSMGGNYSIVSLHIIMQREWKGHSKDPRRQKSLSFQVLWF